MNQVYGDIHEVIEATAKISVAYLSQRVRELERQTSQDIAQIVRRVDRLESRIDEAAKAFRTLEGELAAVKQELSG